MAEDWSEQEVRIAVEAYFDMLVRETRGENYNKAAVRRLVLPQLDQRSNGSLEFKNRNISAALLDLGLPSISGYKPAWNYQRGVLPGVIEQVIVSRPDVLRAVGERVESAPQAPAVGDLLSIFDAEPPVAAPPYNRTRAREGRPQRTLRTPNYLEIEARNRAIGLAGEELVLAYERQRLTALGKDHLAARIEHVSIERGDGAGFDIRSFDDRGRDRFIEVKTTLFQKETPFFISANEVDFAREHASAYALYRVYRFERDPRLFALPGFPGKHCALHPSQFRASFECA